MVHLESVACPTAILSSPRGRHRGGPPAGSVWTVPGQFGASRRRLSPIVRDGSPADVDRRGARRRGGSPGGRRESGCGGEGLTGPGVAHEKRVGSARDLKADAVAPRESVRRRPHADQDGERAVRRPGKGTGTQPCYPVAQISRPSLGRHVTESHEEIAVAQRRPHVQLGAEGSYHRQILSQHVAREGENISADLTPALILRSGIAPIERWSADSRRRICRIVAIAIGRNVARWRSPEAAVPTEVPELLLRRWRPVRELHPAASTHDEDACHVAGRRAGPITQMAVEPLQAVADAGGDGSRDWNGSRDRWSA